MSLSRDPKVHLKPPFFSSSLASQLQKPPGISPVSFAETFLLSFSRGLPSCAQVLRFKDVPFLTSAAQDGLSPILSAPREQEKAFFVRSLKARHCGYLILFRINIGGDFRWLGFVERPLCSAAALQLQGAMGGCRQMQIALSQFCSRGFCFPRRLRREEMGVWSLAAKADGEKRKLGFGIKRKLCTTRFLVNTVTATAKILSPFHWAPEHDKMVEHINQHHHRNGER